MTNTEKQVQALSAICAAVTDAVKGAGPMGAPAGHLYAALMSTGMGLDSFNALMSALVRLGKVQQRGQCYFAN